MKDINTIKTELKTIAKNKKSIDALRLAQSQYLKYIDYLKKMGKDTEKWQKNCEQIENEIEKNLENAIQLENEYINAILQLPHLYKTVLLQRYIYAISRQKTADNINYSDSHTAHIVALAIKELYRILNKT